MISPPYRRVLVCSPGSWTRRRGNDYGALVSSIDLDGTGNGNVQLDQTREDARHANEALTEAKNEGNLGQS